MGTVCRLLKKRGGMTEQRGVFRRNGLGQRSVPLGEGAIPNAFSASIQIGSQMQKHGADRLPAVRGIKRRPPFHCLAPPGVKQDERQKGQRQQSQNQNRQYGDF